MSKVTSREVNGEETVLEVETSFLFFWKKHTRFIATEEFPRGYWDWKRLPNHTLIDDVLT